ncbi:bacillithiol system redox-active protein YtxJ [Paenibacillus sp. SEL1]|uniref:Bacillithiol system redox-active protein YtxJ n=2 Tax=Paenibacillus TaxID=44249 RepID=A0A1D7MDM9_PAEPO|nr:MULTISPECIES: bacillithiol system redox-active protein YtxJ [Paenibacillus]KAF6636577.1 bacillithiol system redox-active protein YtxJ [Paenibacillus sp. EKM208P]MCF2719884.1 bacillithiol system redox-active protein YtxJ [Paenibacillus sp. UKAQ_18]AOK88891.1 general stress protein [Paenibacillus polymyxa]KAF6580296.1 bacillithiol system redox-active protein YtxJ [Paenibacillus sp. EKM212P]KYG96073.1 general stress protein [Paenibacillus polymyxa]
MATMTKMTTVQQLNTALEASSDKPLLLFKHSTRCPISAGAYQEVESYLHGAPNENIEYGIIYVVEDRPVSNETADRLQVKHESPQAILIKDGEAVWHTSHSNITARALHDHLT